MQTHDAGIVISVVRAASISCLYMAFQVEDMGMVFPVA